MADERHTIEQTEAGEPLRPPEIERCIRISFPQGFLVALLAALVGLAVFGVFGERSGRTSGQRSSPSPALTAWSRSSGGYWKPTASSALFHSSPKTNRLSHARKSDRCNRGNYRSARATNQVSVPAPVSAGEVTTPVDRLDRTTRQELPQIRHIFIEAQSLGEARTRQSVDGA